MNTIDPNKYVRHLNPGKFEGEGPETEYYYELMLEGEGETVFGSVEYEDESAAEAALFHVNAEESEAFDLSIGHWFLLVEDSQGFVIGSCHESREEAEKAFRNWLGI
jgi:hypothetical protein